MSKKVKKGQEVKVSVKLEFEGTISHIIKVEGEHIPTINNKADNISISFDGDPILISGRFAGKEGNKIKKFEITINGYTAKYNDIKLKTGELKIEDPRPYSFFNLEEDS